MNTENREIIVTGLAHLKAWSKKTAMVVDDLAIDQVSSNPAMVDWLTSQLDNYVPGNSQSLSMLPGGMNADKVTLSVGELQAFSMPSGTDLMKILGVLWQLWQVFAASQKPAVPGLPPGLPPGFPMASGPKLF